MSIILFVPDSAKSSFSVRVGGRPNCEAALIEWRVRIADDESVALRSGGKMDKVVGELCLSVGEPGTVRASDGTCELANGWIDWVHSEPVGTFMISLQASPTYFSHVRELAERGSLPTAFLQFKSGCGIAFNHLPAGDKNWDNIGSIYVPVAEYTLSYAFAPAAHS